MFRNSVAIALVTLAFAPSAYADHSNKGKVISDLKKGGYTVIVIKNFNEPDWVKSGSAVGGAIASGNPGPVMAYLESEIKQMAVKLAVHGLSEAQVRKLVVDAISGKKPSGKLRIEVGMHTIDRWDQISYDEPHTRMRKGKWGVKYPEVVMEHKTRKVNLPNWHMLYIKYKFN